MHEEKPLYNFDKLREIENSEEFIHQVITLFLETVPANTEAMVQACTTGDWGQVHFFAHKIKSSIHLLNIDTISEEVKFVEQAAKNMTNLDLVSAKVSAISALVKQVEADIKENNH